MLLVCLTLSCVFFGSSAFQSVDRCYGHSYDLPFEYSPPLFTGPLYFTPRNGGSRKLLMDNGEVKDPRIKLTYQVVSFPDLTDSDDGFLSISFGRTSGAPYQIVSLKIKDCSQVINKYYGSTWDYRVPSQVEYLVFVPLQHRDQPKILWNRTDPQTNNGGRGRVKKNVWKISELTQADNGHYNFRRKDNFLDTRLRLTVEENIEHYDKKTGEHIFIKYPRGGPWTVIFTPIGGTEQTILMRAGKVVTGDHEFLSRVHDLLTGIDIDPVASTDSGTFLFRDQQGNVALSVQVNVESDSALKYVVIIAVIIFAGSICCCYFCCKKRCSKRGKSTPQAAEILYHHDENQPTGPSYSAAPPPSTFSHLPVNSHVSEEPNNTSFEPPVYNPVNIHVNPSQPEVAPPRGQGSAPAPSIGSDFLSSDAQPTFELKGFTFPSANPLSSDSTSSDVYHSDKLNFL